MTLQNCELIAFLATTQPEKARAFYCDILGLRFEEESPFALVFSASNCSLRIQKVRSFTPLPFTSLGWKIRDIGSHVSALCKKGIKFERFEGLPQDDLGIWTSPSHARICWFKDADGNILSLTEFP